MNEYRPPSGFGVLPPVVKNILIINVLLFLAVQLPAPKGEFLLSMLAIYYPDSDDFKIWQWLTYFFTQHALGHLFFNMFAVFMFGSVLERHLGSKRFLQYYVGCAVGAIVLQMSWMAYQLYQLTGFVQVPEMVGFNSIDAASQQALIQSYGFAGAVKIASIYATPTIGASGAVFGLLLAFGLLFPNDLLYIYFFFPIKAKYFVIVYGAIELYSGLANKPGDNVAHYAHLGGMLIGFILLKMWRIKRQDAF